MPIARLCSRSCQGFTLVELLIVLAILVLMAGFSWPAVGGLLAKSELQSAAKQVRATLAQTRLKAMESGQVWQFRYQPGTRRFEIAPLVASSEEPLDRRDPRRGRDESGAPAETLLASGVRWESSEAAGAELRPTLPEETAESAWSAPLLFFPNGRTSPARLQLSGRRGLSVRLTLRGITGMVAIGDIRRVEPQP
jgi:type II secretion system protein H